MGKVLEFRKKPTIDPAVQKMLEISQEIDSVILKYLTDKEVDPKDIAGLLAHRLGSIIKHIEEKSELWDVCQKVLKKQAELE